MERVIAAAVAGLCWGLAAGIGFALARIVEPAVFVSGWPIVTVAAGLVVGFFWGLIRLPTLQQTARLADRRLSLHDRVGTALELVRAKSAATFAQLQLADTARMLGERRAGWPSPLSLARRRALVAAALLVALALVGLVPPRVPGGGTAGGSAGVAPDTAVDEPDLAAGTTTGAVPPGSATTRPSGGRTQAVLQVIDQLRQRRLAGNLDEAESQRLLSDAKAQLDRHTADSRAQRAGMDRLAQALDQVSASAPAAESLQQGDYAQGAQQIADLGRNLDQLSADAKSQLSQALRRASSDSAANPALGDRERRAADALAGRDYQTAQAAMRDLADEVAREGNQIASPAELGKARDELNRAAAELGQAGSAASLNGGSDDSGAGQSAAARSGAGNGPGNGIGTGPGGRGGNPSTSLQAGGSSPRPSEQPSRNGGSSSGPDTVGKPSARLDAAGQPVEVPVRPGAGRGERPGAVATGEPDQVTDDLGGADDQTASAPLYTGQAGAPSERTLVLGDRRRVVRDYFGQAAGGGTR
ncbi:MAG: hypothetical protein IT307_07470 [Chloroflexi bacterium]|nr:hypothetical protein [Chloroflexota bacterium]